MSSEAQRIAIAESVGFSPVHQAHGRFWNWPNGFKTASSRPYAELHELPDYLNDLNAMHEAEKALKAPHERLRFAVALTQITDHQVIFTTAAQRAEAFLRTIGKWEET